MKVTVGQVYPAGLRRRGRIPIGARILAVVYCLDRSASDAAISFRHTAGRAMVRWKESGKWFDPKVGV